MTHVYVFPHPDEKVPWVEIFEVWDGDTLVTDEAEVRDHPEVPLTDEQRDRVLQRMRYGRTNDWKGDGDRAETEVELLPS